MQQLSGRMHGPFTPLTTESGQPSQGPAIDGSDNDISIDDSDDEWPDISVSATPETETDFTNPDAAQYDLFAAQPPPLISHGQQPQQHPRQQHQSAPLEQTEEQYDVHQEQHGEDQGTITEKQPPVLPDTLSDYLLFFGLTREAAHVDTDLEPSNSSSWKPLAADLSPDTSDSTSTESQNAVSIDGYARDEESSVRTADVALHWLLDAGINHGHLPQLLRNFPHILKADPAEDFQPKVRNLHRAVTAS